MTHLKISNILDSLSEAFKKLYTLSWKFGLILFAIVTINDTIVYYQTPQNLRESIEALLHQHYQTLPKEQKQVLTELVKNKDCKVFANCDLEVSALSHQGAVEYFHYKYGRNILGAYTYPLPLTVWLLNLKLFIPFIVLLLSRKFFSWLFHLNYKD